ncbi:hypothetical protein Tco_0263395 [Tanacetum coccineum]
MQEMLYIEILAKWIFIFMKIVGCYKDAHELYMRDEDAHDDRTLMRAQISLLTRERRYFRSMASSYEREAIIARQAWYRSEDRSTALEASIRTLKAQVRTLQTQHDKMEC